MQVWSLGQEDPLEMEMTTHSSIFAWKIPWTEGPGRLQSWDHKESDTTEWLSMPVRRHCKVKKMSQCGEMEEIHAGWDWNILTTKRRCAVGSSRWSWISWIKVLKEMVSLTADLTHLRFYLSLDQKHPALFPLLPFKSNTFFHPQLRFCPLYLAVPDHIRWIRSLVVPNSSDVVLAPLIVN